MSAVGTEGTSTQVILGTLMDAYVNTAALQSMLFFPCRKRIVKNHFFPGVSFTIDCIDQVKGKKNGERRMGKFLEQIDCAGSFLEFAWRES